MAKRPNNHRTIAETVAADSSKNIYVLEGKTVKYAANHFDQLPKSLLKTLETKQLSMQAVCLWLLISELAGDDREAYAGQEYLANRLAASVPSIKRWTKELEEAGWLVKHNRTATSNKYFPAIPAEFASDLDPAYKKTARLTTLDQELSKNKRSTKTHKLTGDPMENPVKEVVEIMDEPSISSLVILHKLMDEPMDKLTGDPLKRQSIKETELKDTKLLDVPQTEELPGGGSLANSSGASRLVSKIDSSSSGELRDAPSALGMEDLTNSASPGLPKVAPTAPGQSESVTNSSSSGYPGESLAADAALASTGEEETVHVYNETVTEISDSSLAIGNVPAPRTYAESIRLLKQEQDRKLMERIAAKKAEEAALQARQQEFKDTLKEPAPMPLESPQKAPRAFVAAPLDLREVELTESPQIAVQSFLEDRMERYGQPKLAG